MFWMFRRKYNGGMEDHPRRSWWNEMVPGMIRRGRVFTQSSLLPFPRVLFFSPLSVLAFFFFAFLEILPFPLPSRSLPAPRFYFTCLPLFLEKYNEEKIYAKYRTFPNQNLFRRGCVTEWNVQNEFFRLCFFRLGHVIDVIVQSQRRRFRTWTPYLREN